MVHRPPGRLAEEVLDAGVAQLGKAGRTDESLAQCGAAGAFTRFCLTHAGWGLPASDTRSPDALAALVHARFVEAAQPGDPAGARKVGYLLDQIRVNGEQKELVEEVVTLAKRYGIATPYTSYLVVPDGPMPIVNSSATLIGRCSPRSSGRGVDVSTCMHVLIAGSDADRAHAPSVACA